MNAYRPPHDPPRGAPRHQPPLRPAQRPAPPQAFRPPPPSRRPVDQPTEYIPAQHVIPQRPERPRRPEPARQPARTPVAEKTDTPARAGKPRTPKTLICSTVFLVLAGAVSIASATVILLFGRQLLTDYVAGDVHVVIGMPTGHRSDGPMVDLLSQPNTILQNRAYFWIAFAVVYLALAIPVRYGKTWARVLVSIVFPLFSGLSVYDMLDSVPPLLRVLDAGTIICAGLAVVLMWWGPSNSYQRLRREAAES